IAAQRHADGRVARDRELSAAADDGCQLLGGGLERGGLHVSHEVRRGDRTDDADNRNDHQQFRHRDAVLVHPAKAVRYHVSNPCPQKRATAPPVARKGPNGIGSFRPFRPAASTATATRPPTTTATKNAMSASLHPRKAPSIAPSFMSPPPMPPPLTKMIAKKIPPPSPIPRSES